MNRPRTLIIGLDGATFDLIEPLAQAGYLPALARLIAEGVHSPLRAWPNMCSAAAWSSIITGYNPGQHGIYDFGDAPPQRDTAWRPTTAADRRKDPFWRLLSSAGQQVGIVNVPITYPAESVNGFMLAGMDTPFVRSPGFAHPADLRDELRQQSIDYIIDVPNLGVLTRRNPHQLPGPVQEMVDARSRTILHLMQTHLWDVLMAVFVAPDRVQHHFWPHDLSCVDDQSWTPIRLLYQQIDSFLGNALKLVDESSTVMLISDHGFGRVQPAKRCLNPLFERLGLLRYRKGGNRLRARVVRNVRSSARRIMPHQLKRPLAEVFPGLALRTVSEQWYGGIDWSQTQVFASPYRGTVFVNLQGRQPEGIVSPEGYDPLRERVRDMLLNLTHPTTGRRVVRAVKRREEIYHGPYLEQAADLVIEWNDEALQNALCYPIGGEQIIVQTPKSEGPGKSWTGAHRPEGILIAHGPHTKRGATAPTATLYDIAPTILYLQGHPVPADTDGQVLTDIFTQDYLQRHPVKQVEPTPAKPQEADSVLDEEEARKIEERLRGLGYIE
jgi:predicted AlkP superfamily phosphohydrolase/phosphomutase